MTHQDDARQEPGYPACAQTALQEDAADCCGTGIHTHTDRSEEEKKALLSRLKRIEGQVRGLQGMVEKNAYCPDILIQVSAVTQALNSFNKELLAEHIRSRVVEDIRADRTETVDELVETLKKVMR